MGNLSIHGVEVTQAIQHYRASEHLADSSAPDNSVRLVSNKPALVRVYLRCSTTAPIAGATGVIRVYRATHRSSYGSSRELVGTLSPAPTQVNVHADRPYGGERLNLSTTLNFVVPAAYLYGDVRLDISVQAGADADERRVYLDLSLRQTLRLAGIFVAYDGPDGQVPALTEAELRSESQIPLTIMPVQSSAEYRVAGTVTCTAAPQSSPEAAGALWALLWDMRTNDGNRPGYLYLALVHPDFPPFGYLGRAWNGVALSRQGIGMTTAHELAHLAGVHHAPCGRPLGIDGSYPDYEPYDSGSIGEYGTDINAGWIFAPATFKDLMTYCEPKWISPYHHDRLINNPALNPESVGREWVWVREWARLDPSLRPERLLVRPPRPDPGPWRESGGYERVISVAGVFLSDQQVEVRRVARVYAFAGVADAEDTGFLAELVDQKGRIVSAAALRRPNMRVACPPSGEDASLERRWPAAFEAFLPDVGPGAELRIRHGQTVLWRRRAPKASPRIKSFSASVKRSKIALRWALQNVGRKKLEIWLQWSADPKESLWNALAVGLEGGEADIAAAGLPSGRAYLRILVHDGFFTTASAPVEVKIPAGPPIVAILHPRQGTRVEAGVTMRLWGSARRSNGEPIDAAGARWLIDGKEVARGSLDVFVTTPKEGKHRATLAVVSDGTSAEASHDFETVDLSSRTSADDW